MLLPKDIHPTNSLYFNGAYVLQAVRQYKEVNMMDLFVESRKLRDMSMPIFVLTLDWLFLADLISYNDSGNIVPCS
ncbi:ABC-three component system middle component 6 [Photorhabdus tasmaniensis]|uniref:Uncharacterized protein n=1 Tax=Photorhabdus tasmaniensis TaxID=1004159 RepID=A0ABX0GMY1_9GAMM|nr:hypothetical protein [Photorhabdus tasmaniensis]